MSQRPSDIDVVNWTSVEFLQESRWCVLSLAVTVIDDQRRPAIMRNFVIVFNHNATNNSKLVRLRG